MNTITFLLSIPLFIIKSFMYIIWFLMIAFVLVIPALIFMFLSIFNSEYFWNKKWSGMIDSLEKYKLIPKGW